MSNGFWGIHRHHIVFRSQGGLDIDINLIELTQDEHEGNDGPHRNRERDLELKRAMQEILKEKFPVDDLFDINTIATELNCTTKYIYPHFRRVPTECGLYKGYEVVKRLMGGKFY